MHKRVTKKRKLLSELKRKRRNRKRNNSFGQIYSAVKKQKKVESTMLMMPACFYCMGYYCNCTGIEMELLHHITQMQVLQEQELLKRRKLLEEQEKQQRQQYFESYSCIPIQDRPTFLTSTSVKNPETKIQKSKIKKSKTKKSEFNNQLDPIQLNLLEDLLFDKENSTDLEKQKKINKRIKSILKPTGTLTIIVEEI